MMTNEDLLAAANFGFIPSPNENESSFLERIVFCENIKNKLGEFEGPLPEVPSVFTQALEESKKINGFYPDWVPVIISDEKILPWQAGFALIFELYEKAPLSALIQLRKKVWFSCVSQKELLVHEMVHIARMGFDETKYEEILAYRSSPSFFYRFFGPLFQSSVESSLFAALMILILTLDFSLIVTGSLHLFNQFLPLKLLPLLWLFYLLIRLCIRQSRVKKVEDKLGLKATLCLTDDEMETFAHLQRPEIEARLNDSLRHRLIKLKLT